MSIPPSVLSAYQSVNSQAQQTASQPFQQYGGEFVAPVNGTQQQGISATNAASQEAQPGYASAQNTLGSAQANTTGINNAATGLAAASGQQVNADPLTGQQINSYLSPYLGDVLGSTEALQNQSNQQQQAGQLGTAISSGAFGGDRTGIAAANLEQQQNLSNSNTIANIANSGYNNALGVAQQQQGVNLSAQQANRAALGSAGSELASIGSTAYGEGANTASEQGALASDAQTAGLQGAQAQIGAGTLQQQTQQAQDTAEYNQFLQQQSYPFQVDQFLAGIAEGTGALSGSTTTTTQPGGFFSDKRLKHDIKKIGKTYDGQTIYSYKMHGDNRTHIGLIAQSVEKKHPDAVGLAAGYKTVDYGKATEEAANRGHFYSGGVVPIRQHFDEGGYAGPYGDMSSILATQENMYQPNQSRNRNIPNQVQNHQLAVASGSPTPAPSGANKVQQSIGLGKDAYQAYNHFNAPSSPNLGSANTQIANDPTMQGLQASPTMDAPVSPAAAPSADAGLGAAQAAPATADASGVAAGAAAPAAAEAAAPVAADAAGTAAAGAAGGAAVDAGATEAAALAAEYAAADAAVAVVAAKRGGVIKRHGFDAGGVPYEGGVAGSPYSNDSGQMDIPDDPNATKLQTAGPLKKQPTGLQTLMTLGSEQGASSAMGSMFSNQGLGSKRGGRIGYDDGGSISDDPDLSPVQIDPSDVKIPEKKGLAAADMSAANDDSVPVPQKKSALASVGDWWEGNKNNILPAVQGLAAMGTAPTRHLGVALAAGLGAGAQAYYPTQQASADLQSRQIQNQVAGMQANAMRGALTPQSAPAPRDPVPGEAPTDTAVLPSYYQKKYAVAPMTPQESQRLNQAQIAGGYYKNPGLAQSVQTDIQQRIATQTFQNQQDARLQHDAAYQVASAPAGNYTALKQADPAAAVAIAKQLGFDPAGKAAPPEADAAAQQYATTKVTALHPWTGDDYVDKAGSVRNSRTNLPPLGGATQTLTPEQQSARQIKLAEPVTYGAGLPTPLGHAAGISGNAPAGPGAAPGAPSAPPVALQTAPQRGTQAPSRPRSPAAAPAKDPVLAKALTDPAYKLQAPASPTDQVSLDAAKKQAERTVETRSQLQADAESTAQSSGAALQFAKAAKQIMESKGAPVTGLFGAPIKAISSAFGKVDATNYQEVAKYLGNLAVQTGKSNFSSTTDKNTALQFEQLNPSTANTDQALKDLLDSNIRTNQYTLDTANRATSYLNQKGYNGDPQKFFRWNQAYFPRAAVVNPADQSITVNSKAQYDALPKGATYIHNGRTGIKQ